MLDAATPLLWSRGGEEGGYGGGGGHGQGCVTSPDKVHW